MKNLKQYISEKLKITKDNIGYDYKYFPKTREELDKIISQLIEERGNNADLNDVDVSKIDDFNCLFSVRNFYWFKYDKRHNFTEFNGDISNWDVSNVKSMENMFYSSDFEGDISNWNVSNVIDMRRMFNDSKFNGDLSNWDVSNVVNMFSMFNGSKFTGENGDISNWDVSKVIDMNYIFGGSKFNCDLSKWKLCNNCFDKNMFENCPLDDHPEKWPQNYNGK